MTRSYKASLGPLARSAFYEVLSVGFLYPDEDTVPYLTARARRLAPVAERVGRPELNRALNGLVEALDRDGGERLLAENVEVFGHTVSTDCPPYEAEYGQAHVFQKSQAIADLQGFYKAFGVGPNPEMKERPDHIAVELEFMHLLTLKEAHALWNGHGGDKVQICRKAQEAFLANHLGAWAGSFARRLAKKAGADTTYGALCAVLEAQMASELAMFHIEPGAPEPSPTPITREGDEECEVTPVPVQLGQGVSRP